MPYDVDDGEQHDRAARDLDQHDARDHVDDGRDDLDDDRDHEHLGPGHHHHVLHDHDDHRLAERRLPRRVARRSRERPRGHRLPGTGRWLDAGGRSRGEAPG
jgi:hypothetical protein